MQQREEKTACSAYHAPTELRDLLWQYDEVYRIHTHISRATLNTAYITRRQTILRFLALEEFQTSARNMPSMTTSYIRRTKARGVIRWEKVLYTCANNCGGGTCSNDRVIAHPSSRVHGVQEFSVFSLIQNPTPRVQLELINKGSFIVGLSLGAEDKRAMCTWRI